MHEDVPCDFPAGYNGAAILERLAQVLDPELDEPILDLGFVRALRLRSGHAEVALRLPTSWCAVNFAYLMAEDVRRERSRRRSMMGGRLPKPFRARPPGAWKRSG